VFNLKAFKISVAIVVSFVVCWLPLQTFVLLYYLVPAVREAPASRAQRSVYGAAYFACHYLACANSLLNPLLYCFMNKNFRVCSQAICILLFCSSPLILQDDLREWFATSVLRRRASPPRNSSLRSSGRVIRTCTTTVNGICQNAEPGNGFAIDFSNLCYFIIIFLFLLFLYPLFFGKG
jgi:hypothetical protein